MTPNQRAWAQARDRLARAVTDLGFPGELADLLAKQLQSPKSIDRMASWLAYTRPRSMETVADELLAICADRDAWRAKAESREAQASYSRWLSSESRRALGEEEIWGCEDD
ncbi:MAG: hypothetical protein IJK28_06995 [Clostridia bacterium]|nr:hypothetical protein [Clostridia bacterium]